MKFINFYEFKECYSLLYSKKKFDEVLNLLNCANEFLPNDEYEKYLFEIMIDKSRVYSQIPNSEGCFNIIRESFEKGYAFPLYWPRFDFLRSYPEYQLLNDINEKLLKQAKENSSFKYEVYLPKFYDPSKKYPLFICLHGDGGGGNIDEIGWYWNPDMLLEKGYIVVYPQSSQVYCHNYFGWLIDPILSQKELKNCYEQLLLNYSIDKSCIIIGGFSGGAAASINIVFENILPAKGIIALCPPGDYLNKFEPTTIKKLSRKGLKVVIFEGEYDTDQTIQDPLKLFEEVGLAHEYHINKGIGHWYPRDLDEKTLKALKFIVGN